MSKRPVKLNELAVLLAEGGDGAWPSNDATLDGRPQLLYGLATQVQCHQAPRSFDTSTKSAQMAGWQRRVWHWQSMQGCSMSRRLEKLSLSRRHTLDPRHLSPRRLRRQENAQCSLHLQWVSLRDERLPGAGIYNPSSASDAAKDARRSGQVRWRAGPWAAAPRAAHCGAHPLPK